MKQKIQYIVVLYNYNAIITIEEKTLNNVLVYTSNLSKTLIAWPI